MQTCCMLDQMFAELLLFHLQITSKQVIPIPLVNLLPIGVAKVMNQIVDSCQRILLYVLAVHSTAFNPLYKVEHFNSFITSTVI